MNGDQENSVSPEWMDLRYLTGYVCASERTLRTWINLKCDPLPSVCIGGKILVSRTELDLWLQNHRVKPVDLGGIVDEMVEAVTDGR